MNNDIVKKITEEFVVETMDMLEIVCGSILDLEKEQNPELLNSVYRVFHTIKGNAFLTGFNSIGTLAHKMEDALSAAKSGDIDISSDLIDQYLSSVDSIKAMIVDIANGGKGEADCSQQIEYYEQLLCNLPSGEQSSEVEDVIDDDDMIIEHRLSPIELQALGDKNDEQDDIFSNIPKNSFRPLRILVVEDDFTSRQLLIAALSKYGECHVAIDGLEAVQAVIESYERAPTEPYDLICMDVQMPNMDGTTAAKTIREIERGKDVEGTEFESMIIMISCVEDPKVIMKACYQCGANHYFVKPLDLFQMTRQMQKLGLISLDKECVVQ